MPRRLILVTRPESRLVDTTTIEHGYMKGYTLAEMRGWADDLARLKRTSPSEVERWRALPADQLAPEQRRALEVHDKLYVEAQRGIKGSLRDHGTVELDGDRRRAGCLVERGVDPVPVWVSAPDDRRLDAFDVQCARDMPRVRDEPPPRVGLDRKQTERGMEQAIDDARGDHGRT